MFKMPCTIRTSPVLLGTWDRGELGNFGTMSKATNNSIHGGLTEDVNENDEPMLKILYTLLWNTHCRFRTPKLDLEMFRTILYMVIHNFLFCLLANGYTVSSTNPYDLTIDNAAIDKAGTYYCSLPQDDALNSYHADVVFVSK